jgi:hypothetical protein
MVIQGFLEFITSMDDQIRLSSERGFSEEHRAMLFAIRADWIDRLAEYRRVVGNR